MQQRFYEIFSPAPPPLFHSTFLLLPSTVYSQISLSIFSPSFYLPLAHILLEISLFTAHLQFELFSPFLPYSGIYDFMFKFMDYLALPKNVMWNDEVIFLKTHSHFVHQYVTFLGTRRRGKLLLSMHVQEHNGIHAHYKMRSKSQKPC